MTREVEGNARAGGRRWLAQALLVAVVAAAGFVYGYFSHRNGLFPASLIRRWTAPPQPERVTGPPGRWNPFSDAQGEDLEEEIERLRAIGYLSGSDRASGAGGVRIHVPEAASPGLNLYTSGHAPEAILMDMDGNVLHTWSYEFDDVWPPESFEDRPGYFEVDYWRRAQLLDNGDLLAIFEGFGLIKLDRDSNLLWSFPRDDAQSLLDEPGAHHDFFVDDEGLIHVLTRYAHIVPRINPGWPILEDFITVLTPDGEVVESFSLLEAFERSRFSTLLDGIAERGDIFHTNTIEIFDGSQVDRAPIFARGNALISLREIDVIAIVDTQEREVIWAISGIARKQHQPTLLDDGNMLLFDNYASDQRSSVIEFDPLTQQVVWEYPEDPAVAFFSATCGSNQRLANGDTLITETDRGRALEVDADGNIVWEFLNPHRAGDNDELIASLFEVVRLPAGQPLDWLDGR